MKFPYSSYEVEPSPAQAGVSIVYRPVIPFRAIGALDAAVFYGLLDTGADETVFPQAMADLIGIVVDSKQTAAFSWRKREVGLTRNDFAFPVSE